MGLFNTLGSELLSATTDENGMVVFNWFPHWQERGVDFQVNPHPQIKPDENREYAPSRINHFDPKEDATVIDHRLVRLAHPITGKVVDEDGKPVSGVLVRIDIVDSGSGMGPGARTAFGADSYSDEQGRVSFVVQPGRMYRAMVTDPRWNAPAIDNIRPTAADSVPELEFIVRPTATDRVQPSSESATASPSETADDRPQAAAEDKEPQETVQITGRFVQESGEPVPNVAILVYQEERRDPLPGITVGHSRVAGNADGTFSLPANKRAQVGLLVRHEDFVSKRLMAKESEDDRNEIQLGDIVLKSGFRGSFKSLIKTAGRSATFGFNSF